jgi:hypothetical protein
MAMADDIKLAGAVQSEGRIMAIVGQSSINPAGAAVRNVMYTPIITSGIVVFDVGDMAYTI